MLEPASLPSRKLPNLIAGVFANQPLARRSSRFLSSNKKIRSNSSYAAEGNMVRQMRAQIYTTCPRAGNGVGWAGPSDQRMDARRVDLVLIAKIRPQIACGKRAATNVPVAQEQNAGTTIVDLRETRMHCSFNFAYFPARRDGKQAAKFGANAANDAFAFQLKTGPYRPVKKCQSSP